MFDWAILDAGYAGGDPEEVFHGSPDRRPERTGQDTAGSPVVKDGATQSKRILSGKYEESSSVTKAQQTETTDTESVDQAPQPAPKDPEQAKQAQQPEPPDTESVGKARQPEQTNTESTDTASIGEVLDSTQPDVKNQRQGKGTKKTSPAVRSNNPKGEETVVERGDPAHPARMIPVGADETMEVDLSGKLEQLAARLANLETAYTENVEKGGVV